MLWTLLRRWAIVGIAVPVVVAGGRRLGEAIESRRGPSRTTRLIHQSTDLLQRTAGRRSRH